MSSPPPFIYLNGYAGVGKLTVAKELIKLLPQPAKLLDNHLLIDPAAAILERNSPEYQPLRKALRITVLDAIATSTDLKRTTFIFTDQQSSNPLGSATRRKTMKMPLKEEAVNFSPSGLSAMNWSIFDVLLMKLDKKRVGQNLRISISLNK
jgi:hypothetical protein